MFPSSSKTNDGLRANISVCIEINPSLNEKPLILHFHTYDERTNHNAQESYTSYDPIFQPTEVSFKNCRWTRKMFRKEEIHVKDYEHGKEKFRGTFCFSYIETREFMHLINPSLKLFVVSCELRLVMFEIQYIYCRPFYCFTAIARYYTVP